MQFSDLISGIKHKFTTFGCDPQRPSLPSRANYYDLFKVLAILAMIIDHVNDYQRFHFTVLTGIGRIAMPLFLFLVGYNRSTRVSGYFWLACLFIVPVQWELRGTLLPLNILFCIGVARLFFGCYQRFKFEESPKFEIAVALAVASSGLTSLIWEYGTIGMLWALYGRLRRDQHRLADLVGLIGGLLLVLAYWPTFPDQHWLLMLFVSATWWVLKMAPILAPLPNIPGQGAIQFLSRTSLWIYVGHLAALVVVSILQQWVTA